MFVVNVMNDKFADAILEMFQMPIHQTVTDDFDATSVNVNFVQQCITRLNTCKATGLDGLIAEHYLGTSNLTMHRVKPLHTYNMIPDVST